MKQNRIVGEISNSNLGMIIKIISKNFNVFIDNKNSGEIYVNNETIDLNIYENFELLENSYLIGGYFYGERPEAVEFTNRMAKLLLNESIYFELELESQDSAYTIQHKAY